MENLRDLFEDTLQDVYWAEQAILKALPKMAKKAHDPKLRAAIESHQKETEGQIVRLKQVFEIFGQNPKAKKCDATEGLLKEADDIMAEAKSPAVMDAGLISSAQAVEHYEIARYGTLRTWAEELDMPDAAVLLQQTLDQEHACNNALTVMATSKVNIAACDGPGSESSSKPAAKSAPRATGTGHTKPAGR